LLIPFPNVLSATILIMVGVGSRHETKRQSGITHFLEHMIFRGTEKRPDTRSICEAMDSIGGAFNAGTTKQFTFFEGKVASNHLGKGLEILSDLLTHPRFDPEEIEKEKRVVAEEIRMRREEPESYVADLFDRLIWGETPLGQSLVGTLETVKRFQRRHLFSYLRSWYALDNIVVGIGGKYSRKEVIRLVSASFQDLPRRKKGEEKKIPGVQKKPRFLLHRRDTEQAYVSLGFRTFSYHHPDMIPLLVLETLLGGSMSSRLFLFIRDEMGLAYEIGAHSILYGDVGSFTIQAGLKLSEIEKALGRIFEELQRLKREKIPERELSLVKEYLHGSTVLELDDPESLTDWYCRYELMMGQTLSVQALIQKIEAVQADDLYRLANRIFRPDRLNLVIIGPFRRPSLFERLLNRF